jgi:hypothetical protein
MPTLSDLRQSTTPVTIGHGDNSFTLNCALEKEAQTDPAKNTEATTYNDLVRAEYELELKGTQLQNQIAESTNKLSDLTNLEAFQAQLETERNAKLSARQKKAAEPISFEEMQRAAHERMEAFEKEAAALDEQVKQNNADLKKNRAAQIAFLVASSDITDDNGNPVLSQQVNKTPEQLDADATVFASFSDILLAKIGKAVNGAITGPLVTAG